jgi:hypothetical protein
MIWTAYAVFFHLPAAIPQFDETIFPSDSGVAKNPRVINRIDAIEAARDHKPALFSVFSVPARAAEAMPKMRAVAKAS